MNGIYAGRYRCFTLETGTMTLDGSSMFQSAPPEAWRRHFQVEDDGTMLFAVRSLLRRSRASTVLVDPGWGDTLPPALAEAYGVDCSLHSLGDSLAALGVDPGSVTHVLLTHLHVDHLGGVTVRQNGELPYASIAEVIGIPVGTAKTRMRSALIRLRAVLEGSDLRPQRELGR